MKAPAGLTVCMIVRDERENLKELLPGVQAGADAVVVVDTGSTDGTPELARDLGATVVEQAWENDFSRARNRGLDEVRTSHVVWLDADDRIEAEDLSRLRREALARGNVGLSVLLVNESADPSGVTSCWQLRAFPSRPEHRFTGRIHEQIADALGTTGTPLERLDVTIRHQGYVRANDVIRKARRNLELLREEVAAGRDDANVLYHYVRAASRCGELEEASRMARRCLEDPPPGTPTEILQAAAVSLGRIEFQRGRLEEAGQVLREAVRRVPDDPVARFFLGDLLRQQGALAGARQELQAARVAPIRQSNLPLPVVGLRRATRLLLAEVVELLGQPAEGAAVLRESLDDRPDDRTVSRALVRCLIGARAYQEARRILDRLGDSPDDVGEILLLRAKLAFDEGHDEEARSHFLRVEELSPRRWAAPLHLGHLALRGGEVAEARDHYARAMALADTPEIRVGMAAAELEGGRAAEALDHLAQAMERCANRPLPPGTEALSGEALLRLRRPAEAVGAFENHLRRHGPDPRVLARLADCYQELGVPGAARLGYQEALKLAPGLKEAVRGLESLDAT